VPRVPVMISRGPDGTSHPQPAAALSLINQVAYGKSAREFKLKQRRPATVLETRRYRSAPRWP